MAGPQDKYQVFRQDLDELTGLIEQLKREYDMYFAGMLKKQPYDLKHKVEALMRKHRGTNVHKLELSFRFTSIQSKYAKYCELWDKIFKRREEDPHARSPYGPTREQLANDMISINRGRAALERQEGSQTEAAAAPANRMKMLFNQYVDAKKELGESIDNLKYDSFRTQLEKQVGSIKEKTGAKDVEFNVTRKNGKISLTAKTIKEG